MGSMSPLYEPSAPSAKDRAKEFATALSDRWGVGQADCTQGVLMLVSKGDQVVYLLTAGTQRLFPHGVLSILTDRLSSYVQDGHFNESIGTGLLVRASAAPREPLQPDPW